MSKWGVYKFFIYLLYGISLVLTLLMSFYPGWDRLSNSEVGVFLSKNEGELDFGFKSNAESNESLLYNMMIYSVIFILSISFINLVAFAFISLDKKFSATLSLILIGLHGIGEVFIFIVYSLRYLIEWNTPLNCYYFCINSILVDAIILLLLKIYRKMDKPPMSISKIEEGQYPKYDGKTDPQYISEGVAVPLFGNEEITHQSTKKTEVVDPTKIVISDNVIDGKVPENENGPMEMQDIDNNQTGNNHLSGNQYQYDNQYPVDVTVEAQTGYMMDNQTNNNYALPMYYDNNQNNNNNNNMGYSPEYINPQYMYQPSTSQQQQQQQQQMAFPQPIVNPMYTPPTIPNQYTNNTTNNNNNNNNYNPNFAATDYNTSTPYPKIDPKINVLEVPQIPIINDGEVITKGTDNNNDRLSVNGERSKGIVESPKPMEESIVLNPPSKDF